MITVGPKKEGLEGLVSDTYFSFEERKMQIEKEKAVEEEQRKQEKKSPFKKWYQFNKEHTKDAIWLTSNHPKAYAILLFLLDQMDEYNAVMCSYTVLQEALDISAKTVQRSISVLKEKGFIAILKSGSSNVYVVNHDLAWSSWGNNKRYSKFPANVILSATENKDYLENIERAKFNTLSVKADDQGNS